MADGMDNELVDQRFRYDTDPFLGYFRNIYIFGQEYTVAQALSKIAGGVTFVNSVASTICVVILYLALRPALERAGLLPKGEKK